MKGWKTLIFALVVAIIGVFEAFDWATVIPEEFHGWALALIGIIVAFLRKVTNTAIGQKS